MASSKTLEQAIADITIWRKGEQRAPHKPLLLLYVLANYQQGHARLFDYRTEVHEQLLSLLERFGPQRKAHYSNMPFWRLKGGGSGIFRILSSVRPLVVSSRLLENL